MSLLWSVICFTASYIGAILLEILLIILFSLPFILIAQALQYITQKLSIVWGEILGFKSWLIISAPGVVIHELSHALFCLIFRNEIVEIKLFTLNHGDCLGYVRHRYNPNSTYQQIGHLFIGFAPILCGVLLIVWLTQSFMDVELFLDIPQQKMSLWEICKFTCRSCWQMFFNIFSFSNLLQWQTPVWLVCLILIGSHITLSPADLQGVDKGWEALIGAISAYNLFMVKILPISSILIWGKALFIQGFCYLVLTLSLLTAVLVTIYVIRFLIQYLKHPEISLTTRLIQIADELCENDEAAKEAAALNNAGCQAYEKDDYDTALKYLMPQYPDSDEAKILTGKCLLFGKNDAYAAAVCFHQARGTEFDEEASVLFARALGQLSENEMKKFAAEILHKNPSGTSSTSAVSSVEERYSFTSASSGDFTISI